MTRKDIMYDCPEEFKDKLCEFIDYVEDEAREIKDLLNINGIGQLGCIEEAFDKADELSKNLY